MARVEKSIEIDAPVHTVYNQWTQFEEFPRFMDGVKEVRQLDDTHLEWQVSLAGKEKQWIAEITEQVPDRVIAWRATSGTQNGGRVEFEPLGPDRTRVKLTIEYDPEGIVENVADAFGVVSRRVEGDLERFRRFIESRGGETGAWRGEVHAGRKTRGAGEAAASPQSPGAGAGAAASSAANEPARGSELEQGPRWGFPTEFQARDDPYALMQRMWDEMDRVFDRFFAPEEPGSRRRGPAPAQRAWAPRLELSQRGDRLIVRTDLPGIRKEDVRVEVRDGQLVIQGERRGEKEDEEQGVLRSECSYGRFRRIVALPEGVDPELAEASLRDGVLEIILPMPQRRQARRLQVHDATSAPAAGMRAGRDLRQDDQGARALEPRAEGRGEVRSGEPAGA